MVQHSPGTLHKQRYVPLGARHEQVSDHGRRAGPEPAHPNGKGHSTAVGLRQAKQLLYKRPPLPLPRPSNTAHRHVQTAKIGPVLSVEDDLEQRACHTHMQFMSFEPQSWKLAQSKRTDRYLVCNENGAMRLREDHETIEQIDSPRSTRPPDRLHTNHKACSVLQRQQCGSHRPTVRSIITTTTQLTHTFVTCVC